MDQAKAVEVYMLSKEQLSHYQGKIDECLDAEPELWSRKFSSKEELWHNVYTDYIQMWAVCDVDCIHCVFMTEIVATPKRLLRLFWAYGEGLVKSFPIVDLIVDRFAGGMECEEIEIVGRRGWERVIRAHGGEFLCATYRRPVRLIKGH
jgi:hypothetical protein